MKVRKKTFTVTVEGQSGKIPYPNNVPIPRTGEFITPMNAYIRLEVVEVSYSYSFKEMMIWIHCKQKNQ